MRLTTIALAGFATYAVVVVCSDALAAGPATLPASRPIFAPGWDTVDDRLVFLTTQLASVETSIDAVAKRLPRTRYAQAVKADQAEAQRKANEQMDRNLGMPATIRWDQFYGKTAEKFFYHPVDRSTSYHTLTVLGQRNVPATDNKPEAGQGVPLQQRPPQFDYIYRANDERRAIAEADAAKLAGKIDQLTARRRDLEAEQAKLWCQISARAVAYRGLLSTRLYRFDVKAPDASDLSTQRLASFRAAVRFLRVANQLMVNADASSDVSVATYTATVKATIGKARAELDEGLVKQPLLALDVTDVETWVGKLTAVARRMDDLSRNVGDSERLARDGDAAGDEQRKRTFRESLQDQLLILAEGVLAGDECVTAMREEWRLEFDATAPLATAVAMPAIYVPIFVPRSPMAAWIPTGPVAIATPTKSSNPIGDASADRRRTENSGPKATQKTIDLLSEYERGLWVDVASKGGWSKVGDHYNIRPQFGNGTDFAFVYPSADAKTLSVTMIFRMSPVGAIKLGFSGGPEHGDGTGVFLSYVKEWNGGILVGDAHDPNALSRIASLQNLAGTWHRLDVFASDQRIVAKLDDGDTRSWNGPVGRPKLMLAGDGFAGFDIKQFSLQVD